MFSYSLCLSYFNNLNGILALLADSTAVMSSAGWQEYWLIKNTYAETLNFQNRVSSQVQYAYRNEEERINRIEDPETRLQESQKLLDSPLSGFASSHSIQQVKQGNERQLHAIRETKKKQAAIDQAYERFQANHQNLKQQIDRDPNNENLWEKLQSLANSEDAKTALEPSARKKLKEQADSGLAIAKENSRISRSYQQLQANEAKILQNFDHDPEGSLEALVALYNSDLADSLTAESRNAVRETYKGQLNTLRAQKRERAQEQAKIQSSYDRAKSKLDQLTSQIQQSPGDEPLIEEYIAQLDSNDARTGFTENSRLNLKAKAVALLEKAKETNAFWEYLEKDTLSQASCDVNGCPDEFASNQGSMFFSTLEAIGRGEDPLTQGIEKTTENLIRISYQHFPEVAEQILKVLSHIDSAVDAVVEFIDDSTGNQVSAIWQQMDETTQARIQGAGKVLSVLVPVARVKTLADVAKSNNRKLWAVLSKGADKIVMHNNFGKFYKSKSDGLWWSVDKAGHGGSRWKVFKETSKGLEWFMDADEYGDFIFTKHKGNMGKYIPWKELKGVQQ